MSLQNPLHRELDRVCAGGQLVSEPVLVTVDVSAGQVQCQLTAVDKLACEFLSLTLITDWLRDVSVEDLRRLGDTLSRKLNYLLEPISPMELDSEGLSLQLRSKPPQGDGDKRCYYELVARRGGKIELRRYRKRPGEPRSAIPAQVTREVLARLADDFNAVVTEN